MAGRIALRWTALLAPALALAAPQYDPWAKIPPPATTRTTDDEFETKARTIGEQVETKSGRKRKINDLIELFNNRNLRPGRRME